MNPDLPTWDIIGPPARLKVFFPGGKTEEAVGWIGTRPASPPELFLLNADEKTGVLNRRVVVLNQERGTVIYNPRRRRTDKSEI